ncbi:ABC transporter permease [Brevibacillus brevis X23]|nr:ABC transporter permease [Brevibacillus brevis X23]
MTILKLHFLSLIYFTDYKNRMYQFIFFFQPLIFLCMIKFMLLMRMSVNEDRYILAVAILSTWNFILYSSGSSLIFEKWAGTLELVLTTKVSLFRIILIKTINNSIVGLLTLIITLIYATFMLGFSIKFNNMMITGLSLLLLVISFIAFGNILAVIFGLFKNVIEYQNLIVYPIAMLMGLFYPVDLFPSVVQFIGYLLPMTWIIKDLYHNLNTVEIFEYSNLLIGLMLSMLYFLVSYIVIQGLESKFRESNNMGVY